MDIKKEIRLVKDKHNWWLIDDKINIPIGFNQFTDKNIRYLKNLYENIGYIVKVDENFHETY